MIVIIDLLVPTSTRQLFVMFSYRVMSRRGSEGAEERAGGS